MNAITSLQDELPDPTVWEPPEMRAALAKRDFGKVYRLLQKIGYSQQRIAALTGQSQPEVSAIIHGRRVMALDVIERIVWGLQIPPPYVGLVCDSCRDTPCAPAQPAPERDDRTGLNGDLTRGDANHPTRVADVVADADRGIGVPAVASEDASGPAAISTYNGDTHTQGASATAVEVHGEVRGRLGRIAGEDVPDATFSDGLARFLADRKRILREIMAAYARLQNDVQGWTEYQAELEEWEGPLREKTSELLETVIGSESGPPGARNGRDDGCEG